MGDRRPVVRVSTGLLMGRKQITEDGFDFYSFQGVPYAKAPLGELRFKAPQPAEEWEGIREAKVEGNICWQADSPERGVSGDEDCLFLNIYTPKLPVGGGKDIPVMVFIHGGGFAMGSGNSDSYGPDFLVEQDIILVTINYRLGPLGFLCLEDERLPGNAGLKDQVAALRWVCFNICSFGGNPTNVTVFGESAGGASVHYLLLSPSAKGLFQRAISQNGSALNPWAVQKNPKANAFNLCKVLGHPTEDVDEAFAFLQSAPAKDLIEGQGKLTDTTKTDEFFLVFVPCIENKYPGQDSFICEDALKMISEGRFNRVPYITGFNSEEGIFMMKDIFNKNVTYEQLNSKMKYMVPQSIPEERRLEAWDLIRSFYFNDNPITEDFLTFFAYLRGDVEILLGVNKTVQLHCAASENPVYYYRFSFDEMGVMKKVLQTNIPGACHGDDVFYLFKVKLFDIHVPKGSNMDMTRQRMVKLWTNFGKWGNPTPYTDELVPVTWDPVKDNKLNYMNISKRLTMQIEPEALRLAFWKHLCKTIDISL